MKMLYKIHNKAKPALLLMVVVLIVLGSSFIEKSLMKDMNSSVSSIYKDRLIPASELFFMNDLMYNKRFILDQYLLHPSVEQKAATTRQLAAYTRQIDSTIQKFETTYLVDEESRRLQAFKANMNRYNALEQRLLSNPPLSGRNTQEIAWIFKAIHQELVLLSDIQIKVGKELLHSSDAIQGNARILSNLQIAVIVIITLIVQQALLLDRHPLIPKNLKNFRLN
ncbi:MCP four helix bundle domain-containing protein [Adhaeribacter swui]|uniref:MCP four helix bundle domain-containing protein n=1 Tax=Adhaeribacter swui TaxID=2086471 RepID=A0A7G7G354_9BACT|nr:MCP four helix bundle domain-containing protein [Adhaeribacter swui]QNF31588.1 MCP four helix bundle domain-containing protein [Adhaeribacter swui]